MHTCGQHANWWIQQGFEPSSSEGTALHDTLILYVVLSAPLQTSTLDS